MENETSEILNDRIKKTKETIDDLYEQLKMLEEEEADAENAENFRTATKKADHLHFLWTCKNKKNAAIDSELIKLSKFIQMANNWPHKK